VNKKTGTWRKLAQQLEAMDRHQPAYKDPNADYETQKHAAAAELGSQSSIDHSLAIGAAKRGNKYHELDIEAADFDTSDEEPVQATGRGGMQSMPTTKASGAPKYTPGVSNPNSPMRGRMMGRKPMVKRESDFADIERGLNTATSVVGGPKTEPSVRKWQDRSRRWNPQVARAQSDLDSAQSLVRREGLGGCGSCGEQHTENAGCYEAVQNEATPFGTDRRTGTAPNTMPSTGNRRARRDTTQFQMRSDTPLQTPSATTGKIVTEPGEHAWDVYVDGAGVYKVPAADERTAKERAMQWLNGGGDPDHKGRQFPISSFQAVKAESASSEKMEGLRAMVRQVVREIVRKKEGGGGYVLYGPNKGKKKDAKPAGEFPTRLAAKRAELARFPPKNADQLKKMRKRIEKLTKDPKKRADAERKDLTGSKPLKKSRRPVASRKKAAKESLAQRMAQNVTERLFREEEIAGSPWDQRIANLSPDAISADKRLAALHKKMHQNSSWALDDAHRGLAKIMKKIAKVMPGEVAFDDNRQKMYCPCTLDIDGTEIGPIHFYIDGGHVKCEVSQEARDAIAALDPDMGRDIRGGLMTYQEDHLPKIDYAQKAWAERDSYLDKLHAKLDKHVGGMSPIEVHLAKQLIGRRRK
jgi:hypothetical protein